MAVVQLCILLDRLPEASRHETGREIGAYMINRYYKSNERTESNG